MRFKLSSVKEFIKKRKKLMIVFSIILVLVLLVGWRIVAGKNSQPGFGYYTVSKGTITQEVDVTGKVKPAEAIDFAFETSGKVAKVNVKVGDKVKAGQTLATLKNSDVSASVAQASAGVDASRSVIAQYQAQLDAQNAKLTELKNGARPEELSMAQLKLDSAKQTLESTRAKVEIDSAQALLDGANSASSAVSSGLNTLNVITDIQYAHFVAYDQESNVLAGSKASAVNSLVGGVDGGRWIFQFINDIKGGARGSVITAQNSPDEVNVTKALNDTNDALMKISQTLDAIPFNSSLLSASEKIAIASERSVINSQISLISNKIKSISSLDSTNQSLIDGARSAVSLAEQELNLKQAGATTEQIQAQEASVHQIEASIATQNAQVRSAQASLASASAMYSKTVLTSTISGTVTKVDIKAGEMATPSIPVISVMTDAKFKIEANVPEADIAKIKVDNSARVTLDAYGSDVLFETKVVKIDPVETVIDGVSTYKVTFEFIKDDEKIKSGMTANTTISTAKKDEILSIPQRALVKKNDKNYVLESQDGKTTKEVEVEIGLVGSDGNVELLGGLKEGDRIVNPMSIKK